LSSYKQHPSGGYSESFNQPGFIRKCLPYSPIIAIVLGVTWFYFRVEIAQFVQILRGQEPVAVAPLEYDGINGAGIAGDGDSSRFVTDSQKIESIRQMDMAFQSATPPVQIQIVDQKITELKKIDKLSLTEEDRLRLEATEVELYYLDHNLSTNAGMGESKYLPSLQELARPSSDVGVNPVTRRLAVRRLIEVPLYFFKKNPTDEAKAAIVSALNNFGMSSMESRKDRTTIFSFLIEGITKIDANEDYVEIADCVSEVASHASSDVCRSFGNDVETLKVFTDFKPHLLRHNMSTHVGNTGEKIEALLDRFCEGTRSSLWFGKELGFLIELMDAEQPDESQRLLAKLRKFVFEKSNAFEKAELIRFFDFQKKRASLVGKPLKSEINLELKSHVEEKPVAVYAFIDFLDGSQLVSIKPLADELKKQTVGFNLFVINVGESDEAVQEFVAKNSKSKIMFYSNSDGHRAAVKHGLQMLPGAFFVVVDNEGIVAGTPIDSINVLKSVDRLMGKPQ
jgi:hypothetical protein